MMPRLPALLIPTGVLTLLLIGCGEDRPAVSSGDTPDAIATAAGDAAAAQSLADLAARTAAIEEHLDRITDRADPNARGAYAGGGGLVVDGQGGTSLLEDLARLRRELASMEISNRDRIERIRSLSTTLTATRQELDRTRGDLQILKAAAPDASVARAELAEIENRMRQLQEAHQASEARRLTIEQNFFTLAAEVLRLKPLETQALLQLQGRMREDLGALQPTDLIRPHGDQP